MSDQKPPGRHHFVVLLGLLVLAAALLGFAAYFFARTGNQQGISQLVTLASHVVTGALGWALGASRIGRHEY
jgi:hypothetical protein